MIIKNVKNWMVWSFVTSIGSFLVVVFSFLLPSYQEQMDRARAIEVVESYVTVGNQFYNNGHYSEAEKVFTRAFEFSENKRLDIEIKRLKSRIFKVYELEDWVKADFEEIEEGDFLFLVETTKDNFEKSDIVGAYGVFKSLNGKKEEAKVLLLESLKLNPANATSKINLGNIYDDLGNKKKAEMYYLQSLKEGPETYEALYNLGMLLKDEGNCAKAKQFLTKALSIKESSHLKKAIDQCR